MGHQYGGPGGGGSGGGGGGGSYPAPGGYMQYNGPPHHHPSHHHPGQYGGGGGPPGGYPGRGGGGGPPNGMPPYGYGGYDPGYFNPNGPGGPLMGKQPHSPQHYKDAMRGGPSGAGTNPASSGGGGPRSSYGGDDSKPPEARTEDGTSTKPVEELEAERLKASADTELLLSEVKPIQTDFHFFVADMKSKLRIEAEKEVRDSLEGNKDVGPSQANYLINTNLNSRLMKAWEDLSSVERDSYGKKEELDRRRFMEEDEVASRHCATLTARVKSPAAAGTKSKGFGSKEAKEEESPPEFTGAMGNNSNAVGRYREEEEKKGGSPDDSAAANNNTSATKMEDDDDDSNNDDDDDDVANDVAKRLLADQDDDDESPTKRNRVEDPSIGNGTDDDDDADAALAEDQKSNKEETIPSAAV